MKNIKYNLGGIKRPKDKRDIKLGGAYEVSYPETYLPDIRAVDTFFQGRRPTCGANGIAYLIALIKYLQNHEVWKGSPRFIWQEIKKIDGYPLEVGTDLTSILKTAKNIGITDYNRYPEEEAEELSLQDYSIFTPTKDDYDNASQNTISGYGYGEVSIEDIKANIFKYKGITLLGKVGSDWFSSDEPIFINPKYGHFFVAVGYDKNYIYIIDSATIDPAKRLKKIAWKYIKYIRETGTIVELTTEQKAKIQTTRNSLLYIVQNYASKLSVNVLNMIIEAYNKYIKSLGGFNK